MIKEWQKVALIRRFAGITPEVIENVRTGEKTKAWTALSHAPGGLNAAWVAAISNRGKAEGNGS